MSVYHLNSLWSSAETSLSARLTSALSSWLTTTSVHTTIIIRGVYHLGEG